MIQLENNVFHLGNECYSCLLRLDPNGPVQQLHFGEPVCAEDASAFLYNPGLGWGSSVLLNSDDTGSCMDTMPLAWSGSGRGDYRESPLEVGFATDFKYVSHRIHSGTVPMTSGLPQAQGGEETLELVLEQPGLRLRMYFTLFETAMTRRAVLENTGDAPITLRKLMSFMTDLPGSYEITTFDGGWCAEMRRHTLPVLDSRVVNESTTGASSNRHNPGFLLHEPGAGETHGRVYGFNLVYSGNFDITADCDYYETTRVNIGINPDGFTWHLDPGEEFQTPEAVLVYTDKGIGEMSRIFHRLYLNNLVRGRYKTEKRPLLINSWEAAYFDFDTDKLVSFAERAKEVGIEMLVMDDGWFGVRNSDNCSLGDWYVNEDKLPGGLGVLIDRINALGLKFGIWYEPEMISPDSDLYRAHPDWCIHVPNRDKSIARQQYVIDMSRQDVRDNIFGQMYDVLSKYKIDYVKWDFNRNITEAGSALLSAPRGEEFFHRFVLGTYDLMNRLTEAFPDILLENCSGGGGRFDPGMLYYSPQIWASDNTDALERIAIQFGTSMCYPASTMGAHVSMSRRTGFATKGNVAMWGTFGYELDPNRLSEKDVELVKEQVKEYHRTYDLIHYGDLYRVTCPWENSYRSAWEFVAPDKSEMLFTSVTLRYYHCMKYIVRFKGLDPEKTYLLEGTDKRYSGAFLMNAGLNLSKYPHSTGESFTLHFIAE